MQTSVTFAAQQKPSILKRLIHWSLSLLCACLFLISMMALLVLDTLKDSDVIDQIKTHPLVLYQIRKLIIENAIVNLNPSVSFDPQVLTHLGEKALPDSQVSLMLQSSWQIFLDWVEQPSLDLPEITIDLRGTKQFLKSPEGQVILLAVPRSLPPCSTASEMAEIQSEAQNCLPQNTSLVILAAQYAEILQMVFPDQITLNMLIEQSTISTNYLSTLQQIKVLILRVRQAALICLVIAILLLLIIMGTAQRDKRIKALQPALLVIILLSFTTLIGLYGLLSSLGRQADMLSAIGLFKLIVQIFGLELTQRWLIATAFFAGLYGLTTILALGWERLQSMKLISTKSSRPPRSRLRKEFR